MIAPVPSAGETSFAKGLRVLSELADHGPMRIEAIAKQTNLPISSVYRYMRDLVASGLLESDNGVYRPGERLAQIARVRSLSDRLISFGLPILQELTLQTGETSILTVRVGRSALVLERVESPQAMRLSFQRGALRMLYAGASAKVVLAYAPPAVIEDVLSRPILKQTQYTPSAKVLRKQLSQVREQGYAVTFSEADLHAVGVAAPVFCGREFMCGISVAGPAHRLGQEQISSTLAVIREASERLGAVLDAATGISPGTAPMPAAATDVQSHLSGTPALLTALAREVIP